MVVGGIIALFYIGIIAWFISNPGLYSKLWIVTKHNWCFWILMSGGGIFAIYRRFRNPQGMTWLEVPAQVAASTLCLILTYPLFYYETANLDDKEVFNSFVASSEYYEGWTEHVKKECCSSRDKKGNCTSYRDCSYDVYHPPTWGITTTIGESISIDPSTFERYCSRWENRTKHPVFHSGQISVGDGNMYETHFQGGEPQQVSASTSNRFVNYLKGSSSIRKRSLGNMRGFTELLHEYPEVHSGQYGEIEFDRVINAGTSASTDWQQKVDRRLDLFMGTLGHERQVNTLVYLVNTPDQAFLHALEAKWVMGKKNDVIVIIGAPAFPKIAWVAIIAWTDNEQFKVELRDNVYNLNDLTGKEDQLGAVIAAQIGKPKDKGGWLRRPMSQMEYLAGDISLPLWATLIVLIITAAASGGVAWALENNEVEE